MPNWEYINEVFLYDGTFYGFLTIVFNSYIVKKIPIKICTEKDYEYNILDKATYIETDEEKAKRVFNGIEKNISLDTLYNTYNAFLSGTKNKELTILKYVLAGFKAGPSINNMMTVDYVMDTIKLKRNTFGEAHRLKGLVKFRCVGNNLYYAPIHPDNNVVENVGQHFVRRLPTQNFILHDKNRNIAFSYYAGALQRHSSVTSFEDSSEDFYAYNTKEYFIIDVPSDFILPEFSDEEKLYQALWKTFFKTIAIKERTNKRLQTQYMPKKYWQDLIETN